MLKTGRDDSQCDRALVDAEVQERTLRLVGARREADLATPKRQSSQPRYNDWDEV